MAVSSDDSHEKGAVIPEHGHKHFEETYVVAGAVHCAGTTLETGDYIRVENDERYSVTALEDTRLLVMVHQGVVLTVRRLNDMRGMSAVIG